MEMQKTENGFGTRAAKQITLLGCCMTTFLVLTGCDTRPTTVDTQYGRLTGAKYRNSLNGTRIFAEMLKSTNKKVDRYGRLTPKIDKYNTIVFFPSDRSAPNQETVDRLETWLRDGWNRTLIYVGRDFDAEIDYWKEMLDHPDESQKAHARRRLAQAMADQDQNRCSTSTAWTVTTSPYPATLDCDWFTSTQLSDRSATSLDGPLAKGVVDNLSHLPYRTLLTPNPKHLNTTRNLLTADGNNFAFSTSRDDWYDGKLIVISNAAFLLNYSMINAQNRTMAGNLIDELPPGGDVLLLEAGSNVEVSNTVYESHNRWAWITKPPLKYLIPQFLFWGLLFCFVFFPIFGRPRQLRKKSTTNFNHHISAMSRLLRRTQSPNQISEWIQEYRTRSNHPPNRKRNS